jgi:pimeloyl-ACP methyl ester carboxylesterase
VIVPGAGHAVHLDAPDACAAVIRQVLDEVAGDRTVP